MATRTTDRADADVIEAAERLAAGAVAVNQLTKTYPGGVQAVKGIDFDVAAGEVFGLLGSLTGRANLELHGQLGGVDSAGAAERIGELAEVLGLAEILDRAVESYSGGQSRRLEIARALVSQPQVLFLDEPTVGLDPRIRVELLDVIAGLRERDQMTIVLTTHYLEEAQLLRDRVAIIHDGSIVAMDTPAALLTGLGSELLELRIHGDASIALAARGAPGIAARDAFVVGSTLTVPLNDASAAEAIAAIDHAGLSTSAISTRQPTLDDVYLRLTGDEIAAAA